MKYQHKKKYNVKQNVTLKNRLNGETFFGDIINEEDIDGKSFFVIRNLRGSVVKLTREAYYIQK